eukprot:3772893-Pyramimonas_sp.AAC.1
MHDIPPLTEGSQTERCRHTAETSTSRGTNKQRKHRTDEAWQKYNKQAQSVYAFMKIPDDFGGILNNLKGSRIS